jgi:drug/metabolite transporter (DMT)-like permease
MIATSARRLGTRAAVACVVAAAALWGATFVLIRDSVRSVEPVTLVFARFALASVPLTIAAGIRSRGLGGRAARVAAVRGGVAAGAFAACGFLFQAIGLTATQAGTSAFLTSLGSLFAGVVAWPLLGQRPGRWLLAGIGLATLGLALLAGPAGLRLGAGERWTLLGALGWAMQAVSLGRWAPRAEPVALAAVQATTIAALLAPFAWRPGAFEALCARDVAGGLAYLVVGASVAAPLLQVIAQRTLTAGRVGLLLGLEPVFALLFALTLGGERFQARWWAGAALILAAVWLVESHSPAAATPGSSRSSP